MITSTLRRLGGLLALGGLALACSRDPREAANVDTAAPTVARGFASVAAAQQLPAPIVSMSTLTLRSRDSVGVIVAWTRRCTGTTCPAAWRLSAIADGVPLIMRTHTALRDTLRFAKPICPATRLARASVVAMAGAVSSPGGAARLGITCRLRTAGELAVLDAAFRDSFPDPVFRTLARQGKFIALGETTPLCMLARNRYTNVVVIVMPLASTAAEQDAIAARCEPLRAGYEAERNG